MCGIVRYDCFVGVECFGIVHLVGGSVTAGSVNCMLACAGNIGTLHIQKQANMVAVHMLCTIGRAAKLTVRPGQLSP